MGSLSYIYLRWIGNGQADEAMLEEVKNWTQRVFGKAARITEAKPMPLDAFDPLRGQHSSTRILRWILKDLPRDTEKIVAVTDCDLFIPVLTFVFGEAQLGGKGAVVSTARLRFNFNGLPSSPEVFQERLLKECVHELGHTFGLRHCSSSRCVMSRSNTILDVDLKNSDLCRDCRSLLKELQKKE